MYEERTKKITEITPRFAHLPLPDLLMTVGIESGYSHEELERRLNNIYINEIVLLPDAAGYFEWSGEYWFWATNERNQFITEKMKDATAMVLSFMITSTENAKSPYDSGRSHISIEEFVNRNGLQ